MMRRLLLLAIAACFTFTAHAAVINALDHDATSGSISTYSDIGEIRTNQGTDNLFWMAWNLDSLAPGQDGSLFQWKRASNDGLGYGFWFDDGSNDLCFGYSVSEDVCHPTFTPTINVWYITFAAYDNASDTWTISTYTVGAGATLQESNTLTPTSSFGDDDDPQEVTVGAYESGGTVIDELDGQTILGGYLDGIDSPTPSIATFAADPLATGDAWKLAYGVAFRVWHDNTITCPASVCTDVTGNAETLTLTGGVTLGSLNGPDIPARSAGAGTSPVRRRR